MSGSRRGGFYAVDIDGVQQDCTGVCTYNLGAPKRKAVMGSRLKPVGYTEEGQAPYVETEVLDRADLDLKALSVGKDLTVTVSLANGKSVVLLHAWYAGDGDATTEMGGIKSRWEGLEAHEV